MKTKLTLLAALLLSAAAASANDDNSAAVSGSNNAVNQITGSGNVLATGSGAFGSSASNTNTNTATGGAGGNANATGGSASARSGDSNSAVIGSGNSVQGQYQTQNSRSSVRDSGNSANTNSINVQAQKRNPVSTAYSGPLVAADDTCMGSASIGGQGIGLGLSIGSTWQDGDCVRRKDARELHNMGYKAAGIALLCQSPSVRKAMAAAGTLCPDAEDDDLIGLSVSEAPTNGSRNH